MEMKVNFRPVPRLEMLAVSPQYLPREMCVNFTLRIMFCFHDSRFDIQEMLIRQFSCEFLLRLRLMVQDINFK
jgi:hypothetical protein